MIKKTTDKKLGLKIFSLLVAIVAWFYIHGVVQRLSGGPLAYKDLRDVEIRLMGEPLSLGKSMVKVEFDHTNVSLRVKGAEQEIENLTAMDVIAYVDISGLKPGRTYSPVINCILPSGIEIVGAPPIVRVEIKETNL